MCTSSNLKNENLRKLKNVRILWNKITEKNRINDIYSGKEIYVIDYDVDHFVPWSYIANDELWNFSPVDSSLNSSKSNKLPKWDNYFPMFADKQYLLYNIVFVQKLLEDDFSKCQRDNLAAVWAVEELYIPGHEKEKFMNVLSYHLKPIYDSARIQGYSIWEGK